MVTTFDNYSGTAEQYIAEYLDPNGTLNDGPTSECETREMWHALERNFASEGGAGISEEEFVAAVRQMQERFGFPAW